MWIHSWDSWLMDYFLQTYINVVKLLSQEGLLSSHHHHHPSAVVSFLMSLLIY